MENQKVASALGQANELYLNAKEELSRPEEDVVNYMVCLNASNAIHHYLRGFALQKGLEIQDDLSPGALYEACKKIDERFADLKLNVFLSIHEDDYAWLDINRVKQLMERVEKTRLLVMPVYQ